MLAVIAWEAEARAGFTFVIESFVADVTSSSATEFKITDEWWLGSHRPPTEKVFVDFNDVTGVVRFSDEFSPDPALTKWPQSKDGKRVKLAPRKVKIPEKLTGPFEIRMGTRPDNKTGNDAILGAKR